MAKAKTIAVLKNYSGELARNLGFAFVCVYFGYHLITGQNGLVNYFKQKAKLEILEKQLTTVEEKTNKLQGKAHKLYTNSIDGDLLDEQYRRTTGKIKADEKIYYYQDDQKAVQK
jgi:cell division protein FtsB